MSDSDNYFSDSDKSNNNIEEEESDFYSDDEIDEETRRIIYNSCMRKTNISDKIDIPIVKKVFQKEKEFQKEKKINTKKGINFQDFIKEQEKLKKENTPAKWKSSRFNNKKKELGILTEQIITRKFNPRLPIPTNMTFKKVYNYKPEITKDTFPELSSNNINV